MAKPAGVCVLFPPVTQTKGLVGGWC